MYQGNFTKYQKEIIKSITQLLGRDRPFRYEKCSNNHLKILIKDVPDPLFTGSTPSDIKGQDNFMALVKRAVKKAEEKDKFAELNESAEAEPDNEIINKANFTKTILSIKTGQKILDQALKLLRLRISLIQKAEEEQIQQLHDISELKAFRTQTIKDLLAKALEKFRHQNHYLTAKQIKALEYKILDHANFMLPTIADYSSQIKPLKAALIQKEIKQDLLENDLDTETKNADNTMGLDHFLNDLMQLNDHRRIQLFRKLTKRNLLQLSDNIQKSLELNHEQDIKEILLLIKEKEIKTDELLNRLETKS